MRWVRHSQFRIKCQNHRPGPVLAFKSAAAPRDDDGFYDWESSANPKAVGSHSTPNSGPASSRCGIWAVPADCAPGTGREGGAAGRVVLRIWNRFSRYETNAADHSASW